MEHKPRILVVDDEPKNVELLEAHLSPRGYDVIRAYNGKEALERAADSDPDVILLDVRMPGIDGFEVTRRIRADEKTRLIPVVLVTVLKETEDRVKGIEAGCDDFISKPFDRGEILARVKTLVKMNYYRSQLDERDKLEYLIDNIHDGLIILNKDLSISRINNIAADRLGLKAGEEKSGLVSSIGKNFNLLYNGCFEADIKSKPISFDIERPETKTAKPLILEARTCIVRNPAGEINSIVVILFDVTGRREEEMFKENFLSLISSKLRTPISLIRENATMLEDCVAGPLNERQQRFVKKIEGAALSLGGLIERLLEFSAVSTMKMDASAEIMDLQVYLLSFIDTLPKNLSGKGIEINVDCPKGAAARIGKNYLNLILWNIIDNAIKFNDKADVKIDINVLPEDGMVSFSISDNGPGILPEEKEKIFETFYEAGKFFAKNVKGAGLGLAFVKKIIDVYGGRIDVESRPGRGTRFIFKLPAG